MFTRRASKLFTRTLARWETTFETHHPKPLKTHQRGLDVLHDPLWNKGMAFSMSERDRLGLRGLLPPIEKTMAMQKKRALEHIESQPTPILKNMYLQDLHNRNETLFHRVLVEHIEDIAPLVYTPTVGDVCVQFGNRYTRSRGMYFSIVDRGHFSQMAYNWPHDDVQIIVVTDGSRILGLGDLGANGMGIPIGKLALYCAAGGIAPHRVLPVVLDVGTNNKALLEDPDYIGVRRTRLQGQEYVEMVDEFVHAVFNRWPGVVLQFEDFETFKAVPMLQKYRDTHRVFNDDIQGTGCVTLSGLMSAARNANSSITDLRILCAGAGSAGLGVCSMIADGMVQAGMTREAAMRQFVVCSNIGATGRQDGKHGDPNYVDGMLPERAPWMNPAVSDGASLLEVVKEFKPTVLLGLSTAPKIFTEEIVRTMASYCEHPIIMPMSNPTSRCECTPEEAYTWTDGRAVVATGSPFPAHKLPDGRELIPSQCNNMYAFPGLGLGAQLAGVRTISDSMLYAAAVACSDSMTDEERAEGRTFPRLNRIRIVSHAVAQAVIECAFREDLATKLSPEEFRREGSLAAFISKKMYYPAYVPLVEGRT